MHSALFIALHAVRVHQAHLRMDGKSWSNRERMVCSDTGMVLLLAGLETVSL